MTMATQAHVELVLAPDSVEGDVVGFDKNGKKVDLPHRIVISPYFFGSTTTANLAYLTVRAGTREISRAVVQLPGFNGKVKVIDRSQKQAPKFVTQVAPGGEENPADGDEEVYEEVEVEEEDAT